MKQEQRTDARSVFSMLSTNHVRKFRGDGVYQLGFFTFHHHPDNRLGAGRPEQYSTPAGQRA